MPDARCASCRALTRHDPFVPVAAQREVPAAKTQLIAHDKEVYDIAFARGKDIFASVGADGSVRLFDLRSVSFFYHATESATESDASPRSRRSLEHSTIIYESPDLHPLLRLAWNKQVGRGAPRRPIANPPPRVTLMSLVVSGPELSRHYHDRFIADSDPRHPVFTNPSIPPHSSPPHLARNAIVRRTANGGNVSNARGHHVSGFRHCQSLSCGLIRYGQATRAGSTLS